MLFAIRHMDINFMQAARLDDELDITVYDVKTSGVRMTFQPGYDPLLRTGNRWQRPD